jgi:HEAT repeat protein
MRSAATRLSAFGAIAAVLVAVGVACAREGNAQAAREPLVPDDTASVARLLAVVRGADALVCEMATRNVDMRGWWSWGGPSGGSPLETDSASVALIRWIQNEHNDPAVVPRLRAAIRDGDACVRRVGASFLGRVKHPSAITALLDGLGDASAETRYVAAIGLGLSEEPQAITPLIRALRDQTPTVRRAAAWALGSIEASEAEEPLLGLLERDTDPRVRQVAAWAVGKLHQ